MQANPCEATIFDTGTCNNSVKVSLQLKAPKSCDCCRVHLKSSTRSNPYGSKSNSQGVTGRRSSAKGVSAGTEVGGFGKLSALAGARQNTERNVSNVSLFSFPDVVAICLGEGRGVGAAKPVVSFSDCASFFLASRSFSFSAARSLPKSSSFLNLLTLANSHADMLNGSKKLPDEKSHQHLSINLMTVGFFMLLLPSSFSR